MPMIRHFVGHKVELEMLDEPQPVEVDGDPAPFRRRIYARILFLPLFTLIFTRMRTG